MVGQLYSLGMRRKESWTGYPTFRSKFIVIEGVNEAEFFNNRTVGVWKSIFGNDSQPKNFFKFDYAS